MEKSFGNVSISCTFSLPYQAIVSLVSRSFFSLLCHSFVIISRIFSLFVRRLSHCISSLFSFHCEMIVTLTSRVILVFPV